MKHATSDFEAITFIVRMWRESPQGVPDYPARPWRGVAVHVQSGVERGVQDMDGLLDFMQTWMQSSLPDGNETP
jgi:hypothetical protein